MTKRKVQILMLILGMMMVAGGVWIYNATTVFWLSVILTVIGAMICFQNGVNLITNMVGAVINWYENLPPR